ncbi:MAG: long-chain-acyl-CoA synthetase [Candidatus Helarchaeota archaeon]|nr:long-chain-acyl-CoA synthetase [Candidatus Helarchaeota archaeon]
MVKFSQKEAEFLKRFMKDVDELNKNPNQSVGTRVERNAVEIPNHAAVYFQDESWTWQAFNEACNKIANYFLKLGLNPEESIALMLRNRPEFLQVTTGINKIQGITGLINYNQKKQALIHSFNRVEPKFVIVGGESLPSFFEIVEELHYKNSQIFVINNEEGIPHDFRELSAELKSISGVNPSTTSNSNLEQIAYYIFTSGTTGLPKAIKMVQKKLFTQGLYLGKAIAELTPEDVVYIATPLYHNLAVGQSWMAAVTSGAAAVVAKRFSASEFWKDVKKYKVTYTAYVGEMPRYLLNRPPSEFEKNHSLRVMVGLGLRKEIWEKFRARFQVEHVYEYYGSTESHRAFVNVDEIPGYIGKYNMPGIVLAKVDPETEEFYKNERGFYVKCKADGDVGMALIKLDAKDFFAAYKDQKKTKKKLLFDVFRKNDCYFNSGDLIMLHEGGWLSFYDRTGDTFRWKSENVSTLEVESIINSYPSILTSTVFGVIIPNAEGRAGMAAIKLDPTLQFELGDFSQFVRDVLPNYSIPVFIRICDELELTGGTLKVKKFNLKKEGYDLELVKDPLYFWNASIKKYEPFNKGVFQQFLDGKLKI